METLETLLNEIWDIALAAGLTATDDARAAFDQMMRRGRATP